MLVKRPKYRHKKTAADRGFMKAQRDYFLVSAAGAAAGASGAVGAAGAAGADFFASSM
jgi:hypothetical protein